MVFISDQHIIILLLHFTLFLIIIIGLVLNFAYSYALVNNYGLYDVDRIKLDDTSLSVGLWIKNNTSEQDITFGPADYAMAYYSNRIWYKYPVSQTFDGKSYVGFLEKLNELKPKYLIIYDSEKYSTKIFPNLLYLKGIRT